MTELPLIAEALRHRRVITVILAAIILLLNGWLHLGLPSSVITWGSGVVIAFLVGDAAVEAQVHRANAVAQAARAAAPVTPVAPPPSGDTP